MHRVTCLIILGLLGTGCASIVTGTSSEVTVTSAPSGARFHVMPSGESGITPAIVELASNKKHMVAYEMECHAPAQVQVDKHLSGWTFLNLALPVWPVWFMVDFGTGGAYTLDDNASTVLMPSPECARMADGSLRRRELPSRAWRQRRPAAGGTWREAPASPRY